MKALIVIATLILPFSSFAADYFGELRVGVDDSYNKVVQHQTNGTLEGRFSAINYGVRMGRQFSAHSVHLEYNPDQDVEIKAVDELAKVRSLFLGYRYYPVDATFVGAHIGHSFFELIKGPAGTFPINPKTSGLTYGINAGYKHAFTNSLYVAADISYSFGSYKDDGPAAIPVNTIEISSQYQGNLTLGTNF